MVKTYHRVLKELVSEKDYHLHDERRKALLKVQAVHVITDISFCGIVDNIWYIGMTEYMFLSRNHVFTYMKNLKSLRLHAVIGDYHVLNRLHLPYTYNGFQYNSKEMKIHSLPDEIGDLKELVTLDLSYTNIKLLPDSVSNLHNLQFLLLGNSSIEEIPKWIGGLNKLQILTLSNLKIHSLPKSILDLQLPFRIDYGYDDLQEKGIYIQNLSLSKQPISLFYQKRELIEQYFNEEMVSVNSAKIIFLGDGDVGKTYTLKRLLNNGRKATSENTYRTKPTHGVLIKPYSVTDGDQHYDIKLWDFGGQQIMHSMHRCFLTERSCYVVMLNTRTDRDMLGQARDWLRTVNSFAPNAPIIVLVNQWSKNLIQVDEYRLRKEFKSIKEFLYFSVVEAEDEEFLTLKDSIMNQVRQLDCYGMEFPKSWYGLMTDLENESRNYISKTTYHSMCYERGLRYEDNNEEGIYEWLLDWFNDLGVCFSYHKNTNNLRLDHYQLLNPQWLTRAAYVLITNGGVIANNGILTKEKILTVLKNTEPVDDVDDLGRVSYESYEIEYIMEILRKYHLSYQLPNGRELIPVLCSENSAGSTRPEWFIPGKMQHTSFEMQYEYLPDTVIHRLMIFCYQSHYYVRNRWRKGMKVDFDNDDYVKLTAVIDSGNENRSITIDIYSDGHIPCWQFLCKFREEIQQINKKINLKAIDLINMETDGIKDKYYVESVLRNRAKGWEKLPAGNEAGYYEVSTILGAAYGPENASFIERVTRSQKSVISSSELNGILSYTKKLANRSLRDNALNSVIKALQAMQIDRTYYRNQGNSNDLENSRNRFVSAQLRMAGFNCSDQQPGGTSATGKKSGERDFVVRDEDGSEILIYEGLNLQATNNTKTDEHLGRLLVNYNPQGIPYGILSTYLECDRDRFKIFTDEYMKHISRYAPEAYCCKGKPKEIPLNCQFLNCFEMKYETGGLDFYIYHIVARVAP